MYGDKLCQRYIAHSCCDAGRAMAAFEYRLNMCSRGDKRGNLRFSQFSIGSRMLQPPHRTRQQMSPGDALKPVAMMNWLTRKIPSSH